MENDVFLSLSYALWCKICGLCITMSEHQWPEVISRLTQFSLSLPPPHADGYMNLCVCDCVCVRDSGIPLRGEMKQCLRWCIDLKDYCHTDDKTQGWAAVALLTAPRNLWDSRLWFRFFLTRHLNTLLLVKMWTSFLNRGEQSCLHYKFALCFCVLMFLSLAE